MFHTWLHVLDKKLKYEILVWACALCCAIWLSKNDENFNKMQVFSSMEGDILDSLLGTFAKGGTKITNHVGVPFTSNLLWRFLPAMDDVLVLDCQLLDVVMEVLYCSLHRSTPHLFASRGTLYLWTVYGLIDYALEEGLMQAERLTSKQTPNQYFSESERSIHQKHLPNPSPEISDNLDLRTELLISE
jgi:hypothetical protein